MYNIGGGSRSQYLKTLSTVKDIPETEPNRKYYYENASNYDFNVTHTPKGNQQNDEYVYQVIYGEDSGHGTRYVPIEDNDKYAAIHYSF